MNKHNLNTELGYPVTLTFYDKAQSHLLDDDTYAIVRLNDGRLMEAVWWEGKGWIDAGEVAHCGGYGSQPMDDDIIDFTMLHTGQE